MQLFEFIVHASSRHGKYGITIIDWIIFHGSLLANCIAGLEWETGLKWQH
jgi:hypothetical protein